MDCDIAFADTWRQQASNLDTFNYGMPFERFRSGVKKLTVSSALQFGSSYARAHVCVALALQTTNAAARSQGRRAATAKC
jgi:hypothetical protein